MSRKKVRDFYVYESCGCLYIIATKNKNIVNRIKGIYYIIISVDGKEIKIKI